jgi:hypothetical protein
MNNTKRQCKACHNYKKLDAIEFKRSHEGLTSVCQECLANRKASRAKKKAELEGSKENPTPVGAVEEGLGGEDREHFRQEFGNLTLEQFQNTLAATEDVQSLIAFVDLTELDAENKRQQADKLAVAIWEQLKYRFV